MKLNIDLDIKIQRIYQDLDLLDNGHFREHDPVPGVPSYHTLAKRMRDNLDAVVKELEKGADEA